MYFFDVFQIYKAFLCKVFLDKNNVLERVSHTFANYIFAEQIVIS